MLIIINITKMSNKKQNLKELKAKASEILNIDPSVIKEYTKIYARLKKHGDATVVKPKREKVSPEHKKEVKKAYYEKMKQEKNSSPNTYPSLPLTHTPSPHTHTTQNDS